MNYQLPRFIFLITLQYNQAHGLASQGNPTFDFKLHVPYFIRDVVKGRVAIDLVIRWGKEGFAFVRA